MGGVVVVIFKSCQPSGHEFENNAHGEMKSPFNENIGLLNTSLY